jgi:hypothetical protein
MKVRTLDRQAIETLFQLQRRMALLLMKAVGPSLSERSYLVERPKLIHWVEKIQRTEGVEFKRRQMIAAEVETRVDQYSATRKALKDAGRPPVKFDLTREVLSSTAERIPEGIHFEPGRIIIEFPPDDPQKAASLLYSLGMILADDFDGFAEAVADTKVST